MCKINKFPQSFPFPRLKGESYFKFIKPLLFRHRFLKSCTAYTSQGSHLKFMLEGTEQVASRRQPVTAFWDVLSKLINLANQKIRVADAFVTTLAGGWENSTPNRCSLELSTRRSWSTAGRELVSSWWDKYVVCNINCISHFDSGKNSNMHRRLWALRVLCNVKFSTMTDLTTVTVLWISLKSILW